MIQKYTLANYKVRICMYIIIYVALAMLLSKNYIHGYIDYCKRFNNIITIGNFIYIKLAAVRKYQTTLLFVEV